MLSFTHRAGEAWIANPAAPEAAVAHRLHWIHDRLTAHGFRVRDPTRQGAWTGRPGRSSQDIIVADRLA